MSAEVSLGLRLAMGGPGRRGRTSLVASAAMVGTVVLLSVFTATSSRLRAAGIYAPGEQRLLLSAITASVALPVLVLAATVGRLSAAVRDRRLANLRLLGLSSRRTRMVAAVEAGVGAVAGTLVGALVAFAVRPLVSGSGSNASLVAAPATIPEWLMYVAVLLVVPAVSVGVAAVPPRLDPSKVLARADRQDTRRPSPWRAGPLVVGLAVCAAVGVTGDNGTDITDVQLLLLVAGIALTGLGLLLVAPVFVRLAADGLQRSARGPITLVAARRLQAQPASVTRVVAALMIGLFLVTGARAVLGAFQATPQYVVAGWAMDRPYLVTLDAGLDADTDRILADVSTLDGVRDATAVPVVSTQCGPTPDYRCDAVVATCAQLRPYLDPSTTTCVEDEMQWANQPIGEQAPTTTLPVDAQINGQSVDGSTTVPQPGPTVLSTRAASVEGSLDDLPFQVRIPPTAAGIGALTDTTDRVILISASPGPTVVNNVLDAGDYGAFAVAGPSFDDYDFVSTLRVVIWALAAVIVSVGLVTFAVAAIDRAQSRRREVASLLLLGVPTRVIRRAQLLEAIVPIGGGSVLAIAAGLFAGFSYLSLTGVATYTPWFPTVVLAGCALAASAAIATLTVVGSDVRLDRSRVRTE